MSRLLQIVKKILNWLYLGLLSLFYHKRDLNSVTWYELWIKDDFIGGNKWNHIVKNI